MRLHYLPCKLAMVRLKTWSLIDHMLVEKKCPRSISNRIIMCKTSGKVMENATIDRAVAHHLPQVRRQHSVECECLMEVARRINIPTTNDFGVV